VFLAGMMRGNTSKMSCLSSLQRTPLAMCRILWGIPILSSIDGGDAAVSSCLRGVCTIDDRFDCRCSSKKIFMPAVQALSE